MFRFLKYPSFWLPFFASLVLTGILFAWELNMLQTIIPSLPRPPAMNGELAFTGILGFLLSLNAGLAVWQSRHGNCPLGVKSATGVAGILGALTLVCPACVLLPASLIGLGFFFSFLGPYLPLLRIIAMILLAVSLWMLRPRGKRSKMQETDKI